MIIFSIRMFHARDWYVLGVFSIVDRALAWSAGSPGLE